eukprot:2537202-Prymnesium_polylepis.1
MVASRNGREGLELNASQVWRSRLNTTPARLETGRAGDVSAQDAGFVLSLSVEMVALGCLEMGGSDLMRSVRSR